MLASLQSLQASSAVLAFITTVHLALVVLRVHRSRLAGPVNFVTVISILFAASPWLLTTALGLAVGLAAHMAWFLACEQLLPNPAPSAVGAAAPPAAPPAPVARPVVAVTRPTVAAAPPPVRAAAPPPAAAPAAAPAKRGFVPCPVLNVISETADIRTFRIARPEGFEFKAGQFMAVRVRADGKEHVRCYSISSAPGARGYLEVSVKRVGLVSGTLHATLRPGSMMHVKSPAGAFVYPGGEDRPLVFIAGGVGITPLMSMVRHAVETEPTRPVTLFYSVKSEADVAFHEELQFLGRRHPQLRVFIAVTGGGPTGEYFPGRINESLVATTIPDIADASCLVCGPAPMIDGMTGLLTSLGVPRQQVNFEVFKTAVAAAASGPRDEEHAVPAVALAAAPVAAPAAPRQAAGHEAKFERSQVTVQVSGSQTLLEGAESCGAAIPSLCRAGVCGTCRIRVLNGDVEIGRAHV